MGVGIFYDNEGLTLNLAIANVHKAINKVAHSVTTSVGPLRRRTSGWTTGDFWDFEAVTFKVDHI